MRTLEQQAFLRRLAVLDLVLRDQKTGRFLGNKNIRENGYVDNRGYKRIYKPEHRKASNSGYIHEHVVVFEECRDCCMLDWGHVHHKDGNRLNNVWYNLKGMTRSKHLSRHNTGERNHNYGKHLSEETKHRISKSKKGKTAWNKGKTKNHLIYDQP